MRKIPAALFGIGALLLYFGKDEGKVYEAEPYDRLGKYSDTDLTAKFSLAQLETAYIESVSLDNRTAQRRLKKAISRKKFVEEWQTEGVQLW
jgi:hypothetical protein